MLVLALYAARRRQLQYIVGSSRPYLLYENQMAKIPQMEKIQRRSRVSLRTRRWNREIIFRCILWWIAGVVSFEKVSSFKISHPNHDSWLNLPWQNTIISVQSCTIQMRVDTRFQALVGVSASSTLKANL
jgi:hypothetical protein